MAEKEQPRDENIGPGNCRLHGLGERIKRKEADCGFIRDGRRVGCVKMRYQVIIPPLLPLCGAARLNVPVALARLGVVRLGLVGGVRARWLVG